MDDALDLPLASRGERLDRAVASALRALGRDASSREVRAALEEGRIRIDGRRRAPGDRAHGGERVTLQGFLPRREAVLAPEDDLRERAPVIFESEILLALDKPSGMDTAPLNPGERGTLVGAAVACSPEIATAGPPLEGGLLHRLDRGTSGVVLFAKDLATRERLREAFKRGEIHKRYVAIAFDPAGALDGPRAIEAHLAPGPGPSRMHVAGPTAPGAMHASTDVRPLERLSRGFVLVEALARTGRRHQIRVHLASIDAPIANDALYGPDVPPVPSLPADRLALHAASLRLPDGLEVHAPIPGDLVRALAALRS